MKPVSIERHWRNLSIGTGFVKFGYFFQNLSAIQSKWNFHIRGFGFYLSAVLSSINEVRCNIFSQHFMIRKSFLLCSNVQKLVETYIYRSWDSWWTQDLVIRGPNIVEKEVTRKFVNMSMQSNLMFQIFSFGPILFLARVREGSSSPHRFSSLSCFISNCSSSSCFVHYRGECINNQASFFHPGELFRSTKLVESEKKSFSREKNRFLTKKNRFLIEKYINRGLFPFKKS